MQKSNGKNPINKPSLLHIITVLNKSGHSLACLNLHLALNVISGGNFYVYDLDLKLWSCTPVELGWQTDTWLVFDIRIISRS